ncbi:hypothetical protein ETB97_002410 [Aspergillus alliaceus]|uniref:Uncharacterized protein n=1 Tax=Petromyces alliaceus TaxID=209559 RepID=A0A8H6E541_PETAA|nr:hypothetical protein ETB97_002410 [Aspergillus burnettii]
MCSGPSKITTPAYVVADGDDHGIHTRGILNGFMGISSKEKWLKVLGQKKWRYFFEPEGVRHQEAFFQKFLKGERHSEIDTEGNGQKYLDVTNAKLVDNNPSHIAMASYNPEITDDGVRFHYTFATDTELTGNMRLRL